MKLRSWPEIGSDGDILLTPYVPKGIKGYDDDAKREVISGTYHNKAKLGYQQSKHMSNLSTPFLRYEGQLHTRKVLTV